MVVWRWDSDPDDPDDDDHAWYLGIAARLRFENDKPEIEVLHELYVNEIIIMCSRMEMQK